MTDMTKTVHVYPSEGEWSVARDGRSTERFATQREAVESAVKSSKKVKPSRIVVLNKNGQVVDRREFGTVKIQQPPKKKGTIASKKIRAAVGGVILDRLRSGVAQNA
jgi:hypothetical protein